MCSLEMAHSVYPLLECLCGYGVLTRAELVEHVHEPCGLVEHPTSLGELRVTCDELGNLVFGLLVLLNAHVEKLHRPTREIRVESPSDAGVPSP